jgi:hypothetical protein
MKETIRDISGSYEIDLVWKFDHVNLPDNKQCAIKRLFYLEQRMAKDPMLKDAVLANIEDHLAKGYLRRLSETELAQNYGIYQYLR